MKYVFAILAVAASSSFSAHADPIFIDVGTDFGGNANKAAGTTTTGWKESLAISYQSASIITDSNNDGVFSIGDTIVSSGGLEVGGIGNNQVTALISDELGGGPSNNGYKNDWALTFGFSDFVGTFNGFDFIYSSGTIDFMYYNTISGVTTHLFDLVLTGPSASQPGNQVYRGVVDNFAVGLLNGRDASDVFNIMDDGGDIKEFDSLPLDVYFRIAQNTDGVNDSTVDDINAQFNGVAGATADIGVFDHNGLLEFDTKDTTSVSEPTSLLLSALGLIGLAGASRRRSRNN